MVDNRTERYHKIYYYSIKLYYYFFLQNNVQDKMQMRSLLYVTMKGACSLFDRDLRRSQ